MFRIGWLRQDFVTDGVHAELVHAMYQSRIGVRWTVIVAAPPTCYVFANATSSTTVVVCVLVWLSCIVRICVSETYHRRGDVSQNRRRQDIWQSRYAFAGVLFSTTLGAFTADVILSYGPWISVWALTTVVGYSYGIIAYVALRPSIAWPQTSIPIVVSILALLYSGEAEQIWIAACLVIAVVSIFGHIRRHYTATLDALLDRRMIETMASTDHLTGLWNRRYLDKALAAVVAEMPVTVSFLAIDLDRFKAVNDTLGHEAGDLVIREAGVRIRKACGPHALVARVGGDEFAALVPEGLAAAGNVAWEISLALKEPISVKGGFARIGGSVGLTTLRAADTADEVVRRADAEMYLAKASARAAA